MRILLTPVKTGKPSSMQLMESMLPIALAGTLCVLALVGVRELLKELSLIASKIKA